MSQYDFSNIVSVIQEKEHIKDCKLEHKYSTNKGDGYLGSIKAVQLIGSNKSLDLIFKYAKRDPKAHEALPLRDIYLNEMNFYEIIAPAFITFQEDHNIHTPFNNIAKFYTSVKDPLNELLVLENLTASNYDLWNRKILMNQLHLEFALRTFAKFHGTSFAMQKLNPKLYESITKGIDTQDVFHQMGEKMGFSEQIKETIKEIIQTFSSIKEQQYKTKLEAFANILREEWTTLMSHHENDVIVQGDCWCNNAMYSYEDMGLRTKPKDMKMLDFQLTRLGPPVWDLSYFFYTIAPKESCDNFEYFLKVYHDALTKHLKDFGLNVNNIYCYDTLVKQWNKLARFGLIMCFMIRKVMLLEGNDAPEMTDDAEGFVGKLKMSPENEAIYYLQMKELVKHFVDNKLLD